MALFPGIETMVIHFQLIFVFGGGQEAEPSLDLPKASSVTLVELAPDIQIEWHQTPQLSQ